MAGIADSRRVRRSGRNHPRYDGNSRGSGQGADPRPFFAAALLGVPIVIEGGSEELKKALLPKMAAGECIVTVAIAEGRGPLRRRRNRVQGGKEGNGSYELSGEKFFVPDAHVANVIAVAARTKHRLPIPRTGSRVFMVDPKAAGVTITQLKTVDMTRRLCHVKFDKVKVDASGVLGKENQGWPSCGARSISPPPRSRPRWSAPPRRRLTYRSNTPRPGCSSASRSARSRPSSTSASI